MDSIISNTSWAFIKSLGYDISDFGTFSTRSGSALRGSITLSAFSFVFVDIVQISSSGSGPTYATIRPITIQSNSEISPPFSLWMVSDTDGSSYITNCAYLHDANLIHTITTSNTTITFEANSNFQVYPIYVAAYGVV